MRSKGIFLPAAGCAAGRKAAFASVRWLSTLGALLALQAAPSAQASPLPELGDASSAIVSPQMEKRIGEMFLKQLRSQTPTVADEVLKYYVATQLFQLAQHSELKEAVLSPLLIDSPEINAFAAPGGVVGINLGLMVHARDVHEYASVIAHELAHLSQRHFARGVEAQRRTTLPMLLGMLAGIALGAVGGGDAAMAAMMGTQAAAMQHQLRYSRTREQEADRIGLSTLARAGHDPDGMARMFERMQRAYRFTERPPEFLLTHPITESRIADARNQAAQYGEMQGERSRDYQFMRARAMVHFADTPARALAEARHAESEGSVAAYHLALARSRAGEHLEAVIGMEELREANPRSILLTASYADVLIEAQRHDQAAQLLAHQLVINPDNQPLAMLYAKALAGAGRDVQAQEVLARQSRVHPNDIDIWRELAESAGLAGDVVSVHRARAEYFALHGAYQNAIQHLEYARGLLGDGRGALLARLTQRILDLRTELESLKS